MFTKAFLPCAIVLASLLADPAADLTVRSKIVQAPEMDDFTCYELAYKDENFSIVPPHTWRAESDPGAAAVRFFDRKGTARIVITFSPTNAAEVLATTDSLRSLAVPDLGQAEVLGTFSAPTGGTSGKAVDLGWAFFGNTMRCRAAVAPLRKGCVSFVLTCESKDFKNAQQVLGGLMTSFQPLQNAALSQKR